MNKILLFCVTIYLIVSCTSEHKVDTYQKRLINDVLIPIYISHHYYQCNVQLVNKDKISEIVEFYKDSAGEVSNKHLYSFSNGRLSEVYQIDDTVKNKLNAFDYDNIGRLKTIQKFEAINKIYHFTYNNNGLIDNVTDENGDYLFSTSYHFDGHGNVDKIVQYYNKQDLTNTHNFIKTDIKSKSYILNFYMDTELMYDSMPFSFNSNGTMKEVLGEEYNSNGIPIRFKSKKGVREINTKVDSLENWVVQKIEDSYSDKIREIKYK